MADDDNKISTIFDVIEDAREFYENNQDRIRELINSNNTLSLRQQDPLQEVKKEEEFIRFVAEMGGASIVDLDVRFMSDENLLTVNFGERVVNLVLPDDAMPHELDADVNNGVLDMRIPRDVGVDVKTLDVESAKEESGEDNKEENNGNN